MLIKYSSNNSGGGWWLKDKGWLALEEKGWKVEWHKDDKSEWASTDKEGRWLGALACYASKDFPAVKAAIKEWEAVTGQDASDEGCNCCGAPHTFYWGRAADDSLGKDAEYGYESGEGLLTILYGEKASKSKRQMLDEEAQ